ncbi:MAG TPA: MFS transporter [Patescibacteria group bacterium]|nr:MFS transporter [Patescibacteria group bacterium]
MWLLDGLRGFWGRQKANFKVMIARDSIRMFSGRKPRSRIRAAGGYESIFLSRLGATPVQIGLTNGAMSLLNVLFAVPAGWLTDTTRNIRGLFLISFALGLPAQLLMAYAPDWTVFMLVMLYYTVTLSVLLPNQLIMDIDSMTDEDRVTGLSLHRTITAVAGVASPLMLAYIIDRFGGLDTAQGIRPIFIVQFVADVLIFIILYRGLENVFIERRRERTSLVGGLREVLGGSTPIKLMLLRDVSTMFVMGMVAPFIGIYQVDVKMATIFIFAWIGVAEPAVDIFLSIPAARIVERYGRKKTAYVGHLIGIASRMVLVLTPASLPILLIGYSLLGSVEGCLYMGYDAYGQEIIPQEIRGSWMGVRNTVIGVMGVFTPVLGGLVWNVGPDYLMWLPMLQWTLVGLPIMVFLMERHSVDGMVRPKVQA